MVKNKATARLCCIFLIWSLSFFLSLSLADLALSRPGLRVSLADVIHPEGSPGSCRGWTLVSMGRGNVYVSFAIPSILDGWIHV